MSLLDRALELAGRACSSGCIADECRGLLERLGEALEAGRESVRVAGSLSQRLLLAMVAGALEEVAGVASSRGCSAEAWMLLEAASLLRAVAER